MKFQVDARIISSAMPTRTWLDRELSRCGCIRAPSCAGSIDPLVIINAIPSVFITWHPQNASLERGQCIGDGALLRCRLLYSTWSEGGMYRSRPSAHRSVSYLINVQGSFVFPDAPQSPPFPAYVRVRLDATMSSYLLVGRSIAGCRIHGREFSGP